MSAYNAEETIKEAINSIILQTYSNWEFIICDDYSSDNTWEILNNFYNNHKDKFIIFRNHQNMKLAYSLNECLSKVTGKYIARMDADDISKPDRFKKQISYLASHPEVDLVGTDMQEFSDRIFKRIHTLDSIPIAKKLLKTVTFLHPTILTYKYVYDTLGGYVVNNITSTGQDYDLWFRFFYKGFVGHNINEVLHYYRIKRKEINLGFCYQMRILRIKLIGIDLLNWSFHFKFIAVIIHLKSAFSFYLKVVGKLFDGKNKISQ